jgi:ABC-type cobalamin transport system ATPase subunit
MGLHLSGHQRQVGRFRAFESQGIVKTAGTVILERMVNGNIADPALFLDEPANDLDVNTLRALEEEVDTLAGVALVISRERRFWTGSPPTSWPLRMEK